jgi:hypothetical protein
MKKLAVIRTNSDCPCPFGLPVPFGCKCAGKHIENMAPVNMDKNFTERDKQDISKANTDLLAIRILHTAEQPQKCPYAGSIIEGKEATECNYDDTAPGTKPSPALLQAPFYSRMYDSGIYGLSTVPSGYLTDYNSSKNNYYGILSYTNGVEKLEQLNKMAISILDGKNE